MLNEWVDGLDGDKGSEHLDAFLFLHFFLFFKFFCKVFELFAVYQG